MNQIVIANRLFKESNKIGTISVAPVDLLYKYVFHQLFHQFRKLNLKISPVEKYVQEYDQIKDAIMNTNAEIHKYFDYEIQDIFEIERY